MTFQFLCPQGHLLEGEEAHMGMQCQCPQCGTAFIIPTLEGAAPQSSADEEIGLAPLAEDGFSAAAAETPMPTFDPPRRGGKKPRQEAPEFDASELVASELGRAAGAEDILHIPCPNGHELETPLDMIGQRAQCPHCGVEFRLRREKSVEYQRQQEILDRRRARFWFQLAVMAAGFVGFVLIVMLAVMIFSP